MKSIVSALWGSVAPSTGTTSTGPGVPRVPGSADASAAAGALSDVAGAGAYAPAAPPLAVGRSRLVRLATLAGHEDRVWSAAWHPSGDVLASSSGDKTIRLWSRDSTAPTTGGDDADGLPAAAARDRHWRCIGTLDGEHARTIRALAWSPDGARLAAASFDSTVSIWKRIGPQFEMELESLLEGHDTEVKSVAWSANGAAIATCARDKLVQLWEDESASAAAATTTTAMTAPGRPVVDDEDDDGANDDDEEDDGGEKFYECVGVLAGHAQDVKCVRFHPDCPRVVASCGYDDTVKLWEESPHRKDDWHCTQTITEHGNTVWCVEFQPAKKADAASSPRLLLSADADGRMLVHRLALDTDRPEGTKMLTWVRAGGASSVIHEGAIFSAAWSPLMAPSADGSQLVSSVVATAGADDTVAVYQLAATGADADDDDNAAAVGELQLTPIVVQRAAHDADVNSVQFCPLGRRADPTAAVPYQLLATASDDRTIGIWALVA